MCVVVRISSYIFLKVLARIMMGECERASTRECKQVDYSRYGSKVVHRSGFV